jgi:hypothetical protein
VNILYSESGRIQAECLAIVAEGFRLHPKRPAWRGIARFTIEPVQQIGTICEEIANGPPGLRPLSGQRTTARAA